MKSLELILQDGTAQGPQKYKIGSETTIGYKIPRECIQKDMNDGFYKQLHQPGVYVLIGNRTSGKGEEIYIGQTDNVAKRLYEHKGGQVGEKGSGKLFWHECMAFVDLAKQMQKGHTEYLEGQFYDKAHEANRYTLTNSNKPGGREVSETVKIFCDDFIEDCDLLSRLMGNPFFSSLKEDTEAINPKSKNLVIDNSDRHGDADPKLVKAEGYICEDAEGKEEFLVLEGSIITNVVTKKASDSIKKYRRLLKKSGVIKEESGKLIFTKEYKFPSPGIAASVILGRRATTKDWK